MKRITALALVISLLCLSHLSCGIKINNSPAIDNRPIIDNTPIDHQYTLFTPISPNYPAIGYPKLEWIFHWRENYDQAIEALTIPCTDNDGNCYFMGCNEYLYSIDTTGGIRWSKEGYWETAVDEKLVITEEGVVAKSAHTYTLNLISLDGDIVWEKENISHNFFLSPNGTLFCFTQDGRLIGLDAMGETMWSMDTTIDPIFDLTGAFFDSASNAYFLYINPLFEGKDKEKNPYCMMSVSSTGKVRWQKELPYSGHQLIAAFLPNNTIQDTFLLAYTTIPYPETEEEWASYYTLTHKGKKIVEAYDTLGKTIWDTSTTKMGVYSNTYAVDQDNMFYVLFDEHDHNFEDTPFTKSYLTCFSKEGTEEWEETFDYPIPNCPTFDIDKNMYIWMYGSDYNLCSLHSDGRLRWLFHIEEANGCKFPITLSPVGSIFTTSHYQSLLFCLK